MRIYAAIRGPRKALGGEPRQGLVVLASVQRLRRQEPGSEMQIGAFCQKNYGVNFPLTAKYHVKGEEAHPFYKWAGEKAGLLGRPKWNFHKYLIGRDGKFIDWFSTPSQAHGAEDHRGGEEGARRYFA